VLLAAANFSESSPPPALKLLGDRLVTAEGSKDVDIHGINWCADAAAVPY
jgi:hypothetical protein